MSIRIPLVGRLKGSILRKHEFQETSLAHCVVNTLHMKEKNKPHLTVNDNGFTNISRTGANNVSLIGLTGHGKSTLGSTLYNVQRGDEHDYFDMSDSLASFTQGIWAVKQNRPEVDKIGVLDLQGLENEAHVHYMGIVAMTLSKAVVLCSSGARFDFSMLNTLEKGCEIFEKYHIKLPKPALFLQMPFKQYENGKFQIGKDKMMEKDELIDYILSMHACTCSCVYSPKIDCRNFLNVLHCFLWFVFCALNQNDQMSTKACKIFHWMYLGYQSFMMQNTIQMEIDLIKIMFLM